MFRKLLVPLDRSSLAEEAIGQAAAIARASNATIEIVLVHQPFPFGGYTDMPWAVTDTDAEKKYVEAIASEITSGANVPVMGAVLLGDPADEICEHARETSTDLIVMTSHGRTGFSRAWLGSVADSVMRNAETPVLILRPEQPSGVRGIAAATVNRILVPLDGSALSSEILPAATALASAAQSTIVLVRVAPIVPVISPYDPTLSVTYVPVLPDEAATGQVLDEARSEIEATARRLAEETGLTVEGFVVSSSRTAQAIGDFAEAHDIDVIAMSTHGRGASRWLFGSVADKVVRASRLPVLLRKATGESHAVDAEGKRHAA